MIIVLFFITLAFFLFIGYRISFQFAKKLVIRNKQNGISYKKLENILLKRIIWLFLLEMIMSISLTFFFVRSLQINRLSYYSISIIIIISVFFFVFIFIWEGSIEEKIDKYYYKQYGLESKVIPSILSSGRSGYSGLMILLALLCFVEFLYFLFVLIELFIQLIV